MNELAREQLDEELITAILLEATGGGPARRSIEISSPQKFSPTSEYGSPRVVTIEARPIYYNERKIVGSLALMRIEDNGSF